MRVKRGNLIQGTFVALGVVACSSEAPSGGNEGSSGVGSLDGADASTSGSDGSANPSEGGSGADQCIFDEDCGAGACLDGACCPFESLCADTCCGAGETCLFDACVVPGQDCTTAEDCGKEQYCELAFGSPGGGIGEPPAEGRVCTQELPPTGACVGRPEVCGEPGADPQTCVDACEFQPEPGPLDTAIKWQWGLQPAMEFPEHTDVWATPTVARLNDANCDGKVDLNDPPNMVFVAGDTNGTCCSCGDEEISTCRTGVLRMLDGETGEELWSLDKGKPGDVGFAGTSVALGDIDGDAYVDIVAMTGDGYPVLIDRNGVVQAVADEPVRNNAATFGWGGGLAVGDMDGDGAPEIAYGNSLYTTAGPGITKLWDGAAGSGGGQSQALSYMLDLDGDGVLELLAGNTAYRLDGSTMWYRDDLADGFTAVGDLDLDGGPEVILVRGGVWVLDGITGDTRIGPVAIPSEEHRGGPPTVADFDGDGFPEIGVAGGQVYVAYDPNFATETLDIAWEHVTKDISSARTGSSVFDFEGDGRAEVVYSDECFLRVLDGVTGQLRFAEPNTTFTGTEALIVADVDGDEHAEIVRVSNSANLNCGGAQWAEPDPDTGRPGWTPPPDKNFYQGISVFGDAQNSWVGTRTIWNQHAYFVSNVCDGADGACDPGMSYGALPPQPKSNWSVPWLNNFRQNVQEDGIFDAPDPTVSLKVECETPVLTRVLVRNAGLVPLPAGVRATVHRAADEVRIGMTQTTQPLLPGQTEILDFEVPEGMGTTADEYYAEIVIDDGPVNFRECRDDNNRSAPRRALCGPG